MAYNSKNIINILKTRYKLCTVHLLASIVLYLIVCFAGLENSFSLMAMYGMISFIVVSVLLKSEMRFEGFTLSILFLAGAYLRLIIPTISNAILAEGGVHFKFKFDYTDSIFPCAIAMNIYYMMFLLLLTYFSKNNRILNIDLTSLLQKKHLLGKIFVIYAWGFFYTIISESLSVGFLGMFLDGFSPMALIILAFVSVYKPEKKIRYTFYVLVVLEVIRTVVWGFYKGAIIQPIFIFAIHYYLYCRYNDKAVLTIKSVTILILALVFMLGFIYPFMNAKRYAAGWDPTNGITQDIDIKEIVITVFENKDKLVDNEQSEALLGRFDALQTNSYFYKLVQKDGINPIVLFAAVRQFWPKWLGRDTDKDILMKPGYIVTSFIEYGEHKEIVDYTSSYIGAFGSGYFWGWWIGVILVCAFNALVISKVFNFCILHATNYICMLVITNIVLESFNCFEEVHSGGLSRAILWFIFILVVKFYLSFESSLKKKNHVQATI